MYHNRIPSVSCVSAVHRLTLGVTPASYFVCVYRFVYIWDTTSRRILYKLPGHAGSVNEVAFHPEEPIGGSNNCFSLRLHTVIHTVIYNNNKR